MTLNTCYSFLAGIEIYSDRKIGAVGHAANDASEIARALNALGFEKANQEILLNEKATVMSIRYGMKQYLTCAGPDDTVYIFFSGHGFSAGGKGYLVAHDSRVGDLADTCIALADVFTWIEESKSKQVAIFLDCCHAGLTFPAKEKSLLAELDDNALKRFFSQSEFRVGFGSCKDSEKSYWVDSLGHGVWSYHLIRALTGKVPSILEKDRYLRAAELQDYLAHAVSKTLRESYTERKHQTPVLYGTMSNNFLIADLDPVLPKPGADESVISGQVKKGHFGDVDFGSITRLPGFNKKKGHFVPERSSRQAQDFVAGIGDELIQEEATTLFDQIKREFGYLRQDIRVTRDTGSAIINAKDFDVALSLSQRESDPSQYRFEIEVDKFSSPEVVKTEPFNKVFAGRFSFLKLGLPMKQDIEALIDRIEAGSLSGITIEYDDDPDYVSIKIAGNRATFVVGKNWMKIKLSGSKPREFVEALTQAQTTILGPKMTVAALFGPGTALLGS